MLKLSGWTGTPVNGISPEAATEYLNRSAPGACATGTGWGISAPVAVARDGYAVAVRGDVLWRSSEPAILQAPNAAEAILAAFRLRGKAFLESLYGSFALAIVDQRSGYALLAVDRMGVERLTYSAQPGGLVFSTSAEFVARFPGCTPRIRRQALLSYLYFHMIPAPETVFEGVRKIPPARAIEWSNGTLHEFTYWRPAFASDGKQSFDTLKESLHAALRTGVRAARANHSSGAFLSGGLDSSTVAGVLAELSSGPARTFSIGFGFEDYDELKYARMANQRYGCDSREYEVTPQDIVELIPKVASAYDEPFGNASAIPTFCCARLARQHGVDHLLAGDGGDELFGGNKRYAEQLVFERYQLVPRVVRATLLEPVLNALPAPLAVSVLRKGRNYIAQAKTPLPDRFETWNFLHRLGFEAMLHPEFLAEIDPDGPLQHMRAVYESAPTDELVDKMLYYDWHFTLADNDLRKVSTMCDLAGVRVSYPMLHPDVVDVSTSVPPRMKMRGTELRSFYKDAMAGFLPAEIINKTKHGFGLPFGLWLERSRALADLIDSNLESLRSRNIIRPAFIDRLRALHGQEDARYYGVLISTLSMLEQWFKEHDISP